MQDDWRDRLDREIRSARRIAVLGVGHSDRGDDGAGPLCVRLLEAARPGGITERLLVLDGREVPESQTGPIRHFGPDLTLLVDAAVDGREAGTVFIVDRAAVTDDEVSTHRISLLYLIRYLEESIGSRVLLLGIEPADMREQSSISGPVRRAVGRIVESIIASLGQTE
jgi:hydrogenase 3 maturation protease